MPQVSNAMAHLGKVGELTVPRLRFLTEASPLTFTHGVWIGAAIALLLCAPGILEAM